MPEALLKKTKSLDFKELKLSMLLKITQAINENYSREELFNIFERILREQLNIGKILLFNNESDWVCAISSGLKEKENNIDVKRDLLKFKKITQLFIKHTEPQFEPFDVIIPVFHKSTPLAYLLIGDIEGDRIEMSPTIKHLPYIQTLTNIIASAIESKKFAKEQIKQEGVKRELELAKEMQTLLFPSILPKDDKLEIAAFFQPHQQVGGDYYDFMRLDENKSVICMADVSGKGVAAAFLMSNFQAYIRSIQLYSRESSLTELVVKLNERVMDAAKGEKYITLFIGIYNTETRVLNYVNAGHNPPLFVSGNTKSHLKVGCTGLGMFKELPHISEGIITMEKNSILVCYTDGVVELENDDKQEFGITRFSKLIIQNRNLSMEELNRHILKTIAEYKGKQPYVDDIALFSCRFF